MHGTVSMYTGSKCRCAECSSAMSKYQKAYRSRKREQGRDCPACKERYFGSTGYCPSCHAKKESARYHRDKHLPGKAEERRRKHLAHTYGISVEQYDAMHTEQDGRCAICVEQVEGRLYVDHDHATGRVRGLLCSNCNFFLGWLEKNAALIASASEYRARSAAVPATSWSE